MQAFASQDHPRSIRGEAFSNTTSEVDIVNAFPCLLWQQAAKVCGAEYAGTMASGLLEYNAGKK